MTADNGKKRRMTPLSHALCIISFTVLLIFSSALQCADISLFGVIPDITFALVCAIGFICGERYGAIFGLCGGCLIMAQGTGGASLSPLMFTFCGYLCGALPNVIFRRNFLSYIIYTPIMGAIHMFFTLVYYIMLSESYEIWSVFSRHIIPEFFSCILCMIAAYTAVRPIYKLFNLRKQINYDLDRRSAMRKRNYK